jgi:hypothetical protein
MENPKKTKGGNANSTYQYAPFIHLISGKSIGRVKRKVYTISDGEMFQFQK